jgi:hypothetical protein
MTKSQGEWEQLPMVVRTPKAFHLGKIDPGQNKAEVGADEQ